MHNYLKVLLCAMLSVLFVTACNNTPKPQAPQAPEVSVHEVKYQRIENMIILPGRTSPHLEAEVRPQVGGIIQKRLFTEGAQIKKNDVLYQIDPALYQAAYDSAKASLANAEANFGLAKVRADRYSEVIKYDAVSKQDYDTAKAEYEQAKAGVTSAKAQVESARINLAYTTIISPISGKAGISSVTAGSLVTPNQSSPLTTVQKTDPMYVDLTQSSAELLRLRSQLAKGTLVNDKQASVEVEIFLEDGTPYAVKGKLLLYDITINKGTGSYTVRAEVGNPDGLLMPGMYVRAKLLQGVNDRGVLIPAQSLLRTQKGSPYVIVVDQQNAVQIRNIEAASMQDGYWVVNRGLEEGDKVLVEGLQKVKQAQSQAQAVAKAEGKEIAPVIVRTIPYVNKATNTGIEQKSSNRHIQKSDVMVSVSIEPVPQSSEQNNVKNNTQAGMQSFAATKE